MTDTHGAGGQDGQGGQPDGGLNSAGGGQPQLRLLGQFIKDLSFENPNAFLPQTGENVQPRMNVSVNVGGRPLGNNQYEVELKIDVDAKRGDTAVFLVELSYSGVFLLENIPQENLQPLLMIECPRLIFPFARRILADVTVDGGFPPLLLDPIDFVALYRRQIEQMQAQADAAGSQPSQIN